MNTKTSRRPTEVDADMLRHAAAAADFLRSLAHEHRLAILCLLEAGPMSVGAIAARLGLAQPKVSQHLTKLRAQKLVAANRAGTTLHYSGVSATARRIAAALKAEFCPPQPERTSRPARKR